MKKFLSRLLDALTVFAVAAAVVAFLALAVFIDKVRFVL